MPVAPLRASEGALQCCRKCGGSLSQWRLSSSRHVPSRPIHTTRNNQDGRPGPHERVLRFGRPDGAAVEATPATPRKIDMAKKFRLATTETDQGQTIQPILLKNYEEKKHGRKRQKLETKVGKDAAEPPSTTELLRSAEEAGEHSQEDVNREVNGIKDKILKEDEVIRSRVRRVAAKRAELQGETLRRPRGRLDQPVPAPNVILQATYLRWQNQLADMFDAQQLLAYTQHFLAEARDDPRFTRVRSVEDVTLSGSDLHQGWRPMSKEWNQLLSHRSRSRKAIADKIIRWLWQYEVEEEIQSIGNLLIAVDNEISPFFVKSRHAKVLPFLGVQPTVTIGLRPDGSAIELRGAKFDCFEMERTIRQRMADLTVVRLNSSAFQPAKKATKDVKRKKPKTSSNHLLPASTMEAILQAHDCVSSEADADMIAIVGPDRGAAEDCKRALISTLDIPTNTTYSISSGGEEDRGTVCPDQHATESLPWNARQKLLARFAVARTFQPHATRSEVSNIDLNQLVDDLRPLKDTVAVMQKKLAEPLLQSSNTGLSMTWTPQFTLTASVGKIMHPVKYYNMLKSMTCKQLQSSPRSTPEFSSTLHGMAQLLAVVLRRPPLIETPNYVRLTFVASATSTPVEHGKSPPLLQLDLRLGSGLTNIMAARLLTNTTITDIMLPALAFDVRFTVDNVLELTEPNDKISLIDFAAKVKHTRDRWSSPWSLSLDIPAHAFVSEQRKTVKGRKPEVAIDVEVTKESTENLINIHYLPINLERIQTITFPFRKHFLDITHINSGHFGMNAEQIRLRMAAPEEVKGNSSIGRDAAVGEQSQAAASTTETSSSANVLFDDDEASPIMPSDITHPDSSIHNYLEAVAHLLRRLSQGVANMETFGLDPSRYPKAK